MDRFKTKEVIQKIQWALYDAANGLDGTGLIDDDCIKESEYVKNLAIALSHLKSEE